MQNSRLRHILIGCSLVVCIAAGLLLVGTELPERAEADTPLHSALRGMSANPYEALVILRGGADPNIVAPDGATPLLLASSTAHKDAYALVSELLRYGGDVNQPDAHGCDPIAMAAFHGNLAVVDLLILNGADVHGLDSGCMPLVMAHMGGSKQAVELLEKHGASFPETFEVLGLDEMLTGLSDSQSRLQELLAEPVPKGERWDEWEMRQSIKAELENLRVSGDRRRRALERLRILDEKDRPEGMDTSDWVAEVYAETRAAVAAQAKPRAQEIGQ